MISTLLLTLAYFFFAVKHFGQHRLHNAWTMNLLKRHLQETGLHLDIFLEAPNRGPELLFFTFSDQWTFLISDMFLKKCI